MPAGRSNSPHPLHRAYRLTWLVPGSARLCSQLARLRGAIPHVFEVTLWSGTALRVPGELIGVSRTLWQLGVYEQLATDLIVRAARDWVVYDVGANVGYFSLLCAGACARRVLAFEPLAHNLEFLRASVANNALATVEVLPFGLGDRPERVILYATEASSSSSVSAFGAPSDRALGEFEIVRLDAIRSERGLELPDLVKIDVEGFELRALRGMEGVLREAMPHILLELNDGMLARAGTSRAETLSFLEALGYHEFYDVDARALGRLRPSTFNALVVSPRTRDALHARFRLPSRWLR